MRSAPASIAASNTWRDPSTLISCARSPSPMMAKARWTTTSASLTASRTLFLSRTSPWRYSVLRQPSDAGSNGRRARPTIRFTRRERSSASTTARPRSPVGPVTATVRPVLATRAFIPKRPRHSCEDAQASLGGRRGAEPREAPKRGTRARVARALRRERGSAARGRARRCSGDERGPDTGAAHPRGRDERARVRRRPGEAQPPVRAGPAAASVHGAQRPQQHPQRRVRERRLLRPGRPARARYATPLDVAVRRLRLARVRLARPRGDDLRRPRPPATHAVRPEYARHAGELRAPTA